MNNAISEKRRGDLAELHVTSLLLADAELEVFTTASDDGHGSDLAVRSARTRRWYSIQVKAATLKTPPFVYLKSFRPEPDYIVAAVVLDDTGQPTRVFLVPGEAWEKDRSGCLGRNEAGGKSGPYVEVRTTAKKHAKELDKYAFERVAPTL